MSNAKPIPSVSVRCATISRSTKTCEFGMLPKQERLRQLDHDIPELVVWNGRAKMTQQEISKAKNPDLRGSTAAMRRAAEMARSAAIQTNTEIVVLKQDKIVRITAEELRMERRT